LLKYDYYANVSIVNYESQSLWLRNMTYVTLESIVATFLDWWTW